MSINVRSLWETRFGRKWIAAYVLSCAFLGGAVLCNSGLLAQETVTLTSPITYPNVTGFGLSGFNVDTIGRSVYIQWTGNTGEKFSANYPTPAPIDHPGQPTGNQLIHTINTSNFTVNSLSKQLYQRLQADGYIGPGTISGSPQ